MQSTKARFASFYDATGNSPTLVNGILEVLGDDGSAGVVSSDFKISVKDIISSSFSSYNAGTDLTMDVTAAVVALGHKHVITVIYGESRQLTRKSFIIYEVAGETANGLATKFRDAINAHGVLTAAGATDQIEITLDTGLTFEVVSTLVVGIGVPHVQAIGINADLDADGLTGYAPANTYDVTEIMHYADVPSGTNKKTSERTVVVSRIFTLVANIATYATVTADSLGAILAGAHGGNVTGEEYLDSGAVIA
jgi:hypothetical protein